MTVAIATRNLPFPQNLRAAQRRYIEAVDRNGTLPAAARALGISPSTIHAHLATARMRTGTKSTADLVRMYRQATERSPA